MSSRNLLLSDRARVYASVLYEVMEDIAEALRGGATMSDVLPDALARLNKAGFTEVDYLELRTADGLDGLERADVPGRLFAAAWLAGVRLIDNIAV